MRLNINKACDLSSISVLPPHSRRPNTVNSGADASGLGRNHGSQLRSQSQQSLSQGISLSQMSQNSFVDNLGNDQKFDSQERDKTSRRFSTLAPVIATRDESQLQMQLQQTSNNVMRRWSGTPSLDNKCLVSEELERRLRLLESSLNKIGMILDSLQSDVMQVNRAVKEVSLEIDGIRQKANILENSLQQVLKEEEDIKAFLRGNMKTISDQVMMKEDWNKLNEMSAAIPAFPKQVEAQLLEFRHEICLLIRKNMEILTNNVKSVIYSSKEARGCQNLRHQECRTSKLEIPVLPSLGHLGRDAALKKEVETSRVLKSKLAISRKCPTIKQEDIPLEMVLVESDEESDGSLCCILANKKTSVLDRESQLDKEAKQETLRILRKARKRKRRFSNYINIV